MLEAVDAYNYEQPWSDFCVVEESASLFQLYLQDMIDFWGRYFELKVGEYLNTRIKMLI